MLISVSTRLVFFRDWELSGWKIPVNWLRPMAGATIERFGMVTSLSLEVQGPVNLDFSKTRVEWCFQLFRVFLQAWFFKNLYIFWFSRVFQFWIHKFLETWATTLMNGPFIIQWLPLITHDAAQPGFTNLFSWHIWGWNHDAAADYAGVQLVTRQLCLENYWHIANALCVDKAPLLSPFDESIQLIDWLVLGATHCETIFSNSFFKIAIGQNVKLVSFHSERSPKFIMSENRAVYQTNEPNECAQSAMLLQGHSTHADIRESARVNYWVGSHNPTRTWSNWMYQLWISDGFEWFFTVNFLYPKLCPRSIQATHACHSEVLIRFFWFFWDGQPFSCTCLPNVTHCGKEICPTCLF